MPVVLALTGHSLATSALSARWLVRIGKRSCGIYLWHFPILSIAINNLPSKIPVPVGLALGVALTFVVAALSYRFVEQPILLWRPRDRSGTAAPPQPNPSALHGRHGG